MKKIGKLKYYKIEGLKEKYVVESGMNYDRMWDLI